MTTGITAVGGDTPHVLPRRLAVVVLVAIATFAAARFLTFSSSPSPSRTTESSGAGTTQQRIATLEASIRRDPANASAWQQLGSVYLRRALETEDGAFADLSLQALDRADELVPSQPKTSVIRGAVMLYLHEFAAARELVEPITEQDPFDPDALTVLVDANVELGRYEAAAANLQQLLDLRPGLPAYSRTSYFRELHGDLAGAEQAMRLALTAGAGDAFDVATITTFLGDFAFGSGDVSAAGARYREALRTKPGHVLATLGEARVLAAQGRRGEAMAKLRDFTRVQLPPAIILLGDLQGAMGRSADAARSFRSVRSNFRQQRADGAINDLETALFEADHGRPEPALVAARSAYAARPTNVHTADALAWALARTGDARAAEPFIAQALRLGSADAGLHFHAAVIADATGDTAEAQRELAYVFARNPFFSFSQRELAGTLAGRLGVPTPAAWAHDPDATPAGLDPVTAQTFSPNASQSGFSQTKLGSRTLAVSAGSAVTPQYGQIGARSISASSQSLMTRVPVRVR